MSVHPIHRFLTRPGKATVRAVVVGLNVGLAMTTVFAAYGGSIDPAVCVFASLAAMALPAVLLVGLIFVVLDLLLWRKAVWPILVAWVVSLPPILAFSPVNVHVGDLTESEKERSFTFMTYNVLHFWDFRGNVPGLESNATIDFILDEDPDIVSLQEADMIKEWPMWRITSAQLRRLTERYPFRVVGLYDQFSVLSKYPFTVDRIQVPEKMKTRVSFYRISMRGQVLHLANCHLQSIGLDHSDKALYQSLFDKSPWAERVMAREVREVKTKLISKLRAAFLERKQQAEFVRHCVDSIGGNWIVAGDFNDIPSCYAVRTIMGDDMHDVYAEEAFGPTITYHGNRFYFRIDQMLYKGDFDAMRIRRPKIPSSDHYPLVATFVFDE